MAKNMRVNVKFLCLVIGVLSIAAGDSRNSSIRDAEANILTDIFFNLCVPYGNSIQALGEELTPEIADDTADRHVKNTAEMLGFEYEVQSANSKAGPTLMIPFLFAPSKKVQKKAKRPWARAYARKRICEVTGVDKKPLSLTSIIDGLRKQDTSWKVVKEEAYQLKSNPNHKGIRFTLCQSTESPNVDYHVKVNVPDKIKKQDQVKIRLHYEKCVVSN